MSALHATETELLAGRIPWWRGLIYAFIGMGLATLVLLVVGEIVCRLLPVNEGLRTQSVNSENPVYRFEPNRTSVWSRGWNFSSVNRVHANNEGFVNDIDYQTEGLRPLLAVIGDSYIEAAMVPFRETTQGRLATNLDGRGRVYSFAASGAGLTQYLVWAEHARDRYRPDMFVFLNISNDFSESLYHRGRSPGFHHFVRLPDDRAEIRRVDYEPTRIRRLARYSALAMYLVTNLKIEQVLKFDFQSVGADTKRWAANISRDGTPEEYADYQWATRTFLDRLPAATGLTADRIVIATDGLRDAIYNPQERNTLMDSVWGRMRAYMATEARARGFEVIDMQPVFERAYKIDGRKFEYATDTHWNGHGHEMLAAEIQGTEPFSRLFGKVK